MRSVYRALPLLLSAIVAINATGCGQQDQKNGVSSHKSSPEQTTPPKQGTAITQKQGNLEINFTHLVGYSKPVVHHAYCQNGRYMVDVPSGRRVLDGKSIKTLCQVLISGRIPDGNQQCPKLTKTTPQVVIEGKLDGKDFSARYSQGPCAKGFEVWNKLVETWQGPIPMRTAPNGVQKIMLLLPKPNQQKPRFLMAPADDPEWQKRYGGMPPCEISMPRNPYHVCAVRIKGSASALITIRMTATQTEQLIGASPQVVFQLIRNAQVVPVPPGYPGYVPQQQGVLPRGGLGNP